MTPTLNDLLFSPPLAALLGILTVIGVTFLGDRLARSVRGPKVEILDLAAGFTITASLLGSLCHALALAGLVRLEVLRTIGGIVAMLGVWRLWKISQKWRSILD